MRPFWLAFVLILGAAPAMANARITLLMDALGLAEAVQVLREEGLNHATTLNTEMLNGQGGAFWSSQLEEIYAADRIQEIVRQALERELSSDDVEAALDFFGSEPGATIIDLENAARRAMSDSDVENKARARVAELRETDRDYYAQVERFVDVNDLLERNVTGAMTANYQFQKGLSDGRYLIQDEAEILAEIWADEEAIRSDTESWLFGFLLMAYDPLPAADLDAYITYSQSAEGQALNAALFAGFDAVYKDVSYALGWAVALNADGEEI